MLAQKRRRLLVLWKRKLLELQRSMGSLINIGARDKSSLRDSLPIDQMIKEVLGRSYVKEVSSGAGGGAR
jgi:hypothetical protein